MCRASSVTWICVNRRISGWTTGFRVVFTNGLVDLTDPDTLRGYLGAVGLILNGKRSPSTTG
jgi:hypothetical protein